MKADDLVRYQMEVLNIIERKLRRASSLRVAEKLTTWRTRLMWNMPG